MSDQKSSEEEMWFEVVNVTEFTDKQAILYNACEQLIRRHGRVIMAATGGGGLDCSLHFAPINDKQVVHLDIILKPGCERTRRVVAKVLGGDGKNPVFEAEYSIKQNGDAWESRGDVSMYVEGQWETDLLRKSQVQMPPVKAGD